MPGSFVPAGVFSDRAAFFLPPCLGAESEEDPFKVKTGGSACPELDGSSGREPQEGGDEPLTASAIRGVPP